MSAARTASFRRAFTLLEVVMALAVTAILLAGASFFLFALSNIWLRTETEPTLEEHYLGLTRFLDYVALHADTSDSGSSSASSASGARGNSPTVPAGTAAQQSASSEATANLSWSYPPNESTAGDPYISFTLYDAPPLLMMEEDNPQSKLSCWLMLDEREGLYLLWRTARQQAENSWDIQRTLLSRLVTKINYQYYDESTETWVDDDSPPPKTMAKGTVKSVYFHFNLNGAERVHKIYLRNKPSSPPLIY